MGTTGAMGMKESIDRGWITKYNAMLWHLQSNHYPPVPSSMVKPCLKAIEYANKGEWDKRVRLPEGISYKGKRTAPVTAMVEQHHLDSFLDSEEEYYEE